MVAYAVCRRTCEKDTFFPETHAAGQCKWYQLQNYWTVRTLHGSQAAAKSTIVNRIVVYTSNRALREPAARVAGRRHFGDSTITICRPSMEGSVSTLAMPNVSVRTRSSRR